MNRLARSLGSLLLGCTVLALPVAALAEYPDKPIRLIVPQAPGSATDVVGRVLAEAMGMAVLAVTATLPPAMTEPDAGDFEVVDDGQFAKQATRLNS